MIVYIVHNIDTEGPLAENCVKFDDDCNFNNFESIRADFDSEDIADITARHRARTLASWAEISGMLQKATSEKQRTTLRDSFGGGWVFNWFCMDHLGFTDNPRQRAMGIHQIYDFYDDMAKRQNMGDTIHWHFHPMSTYKEANKCATSYINSPHLWEILGRRLLDRGWFPKANRPGFQDERPDSHWFLEQWIPFDFGNAASGDIDMEQNPDMTDGRFSDWRWAPKDWRTYHPHHDCHQLEGNCRRKIARSLTLLSRFANLTEGELELGFKRAASGQPTMVAVESHDWRDLNLEMDYFRSLLARVSAKYPDVKFRFSDSVTAFNAVHPAPAADNVQLSCNLLFGKDGLPQRVNVEVPCGKIFGPQPFFVVRTRSGRIIHDNMKYWRSLQDFNYVFDDESVHPSDVKSIGIATNDSAGNQSIHTIEIDDHLNGGAAAVSF